MAKLKEQTMKKHAALAAIAAAALLSVPAFAQSSVSSGSGAGVTSGSGDTVTPAMPAASVTVQPSTTTTAQPSPRLLPGGAMLQYSSTTVMGGPSGEASGTKTEITRYWVNVPANATSNADFQRWQRLK
jgi:hypothetical protein